MQVELLLKHGGTIAEHIREEFANQKIEERLKNEGVTVILERINGQFRIKIGQLIQTVKK